MVSAVSRFSAVGIVGVALAASAFYFAFINFSGTSNSSEKKEEEVTTLTYADSRIEFQYPNELSVNARISPVDSRVFLIDVQSKNQTIEDPIPLRIQLLPKQTKVACDSIGGTAGAPIPLGVTSVQPCLIPRMFANAGTGMRMEIPRDTFTALFFADRYDLNGAIANTILSSVKWK